jgi:enamine deaminase RidA (YjgF/YER057c/UK114 family)
MPPALKMAHMDKPIFSVTPGYGQRQLREFHYSQVVRYGDRVETAGQRGWNDDWCYPESVRDEIIRPSTTSNGHWQPQEHLGTK